MPETRVILIADDQIHPTNSGGRLELLGECLALKAAGVRVTLVCFVRGPLPPEHLRSHHALADDVHIVRRRGVLRSTMLHPSLPYQLSSRLVPRRLPITGRFDAVIASHDWSMIAARRLSAQVAAPIILRSHNDEVAFMRALRLAARGFRRFYYWSEEKRLESRFDWVVDGARCVLLLSSADATRYSHAGIPTSLLPPVMLAPSPNASEAAQLESRRAELLFVGALDMPPAVAGLRWFLAEAWPAIASETGASLVVAGRRASDALRGQLEQTNGVQFLGEVPDVEPLYLRATAFINPVFAGSGLSMKVAQPAARGLPVVTSPFGARGFEFLSDALVIRETGASFAEACIRLLTDQEYHSATADRLREAAANHSPAAIGARYRAALVI